jgi:isopenicillin N synthase-like dioxygenase
MTPISSLPLLFLFLLLTAVLTHAQVPVIDLSGLGKDVHTSAQIDQALQQYGLFVGTNALQSSASLASMRAAEELFALPSEEKQRIKVAGGGFMRGYIPFGQESGLKDTFFEPKEGFAYGYSFEDREGAGNGDSDGTTGGDSEFRNALEGDNVWPAEELFTGKKIMKLMFDMSTRIATNIVNSVSASYKHHTKEDLGLILDGGDRISIMRLFHYFAKSDKSVIGDRAEESIIGSSPHTDWGLLTVITQQEQIGGLQALYNGNWVDVPSDIPGSVVVNGGDFLSLLSKGRYKSPVHRVQSPKSSDRMSYVYFFYPNFDTPLDMACTLKDEGGIASGADTEGKQEYNTLLSRDALHGDDSDAELVFGDYIVNKWKGVFRPDVSTEV